MLRSAHEIEGARRQHRDRPRRRHRGDPGRIELFELIRRQRAVARGKRGAVAVRQLLGMDLERQAVRGGGLEHEFGMRGGETPAFAKGKIGRAWWRERVCKYV